MPPAGTGSLDANAVTAIQAERIDWRFKGMPSATFGMTVAEAAASRPNLFDDGFVGPLLVLSADALEHNLSTMARWCDERGIALCPHGKTTMAPQLFAKQFEHGAWGITAANASQMRVYRAFGVSRIVLANQLVDAHALRWLARELERDPGFTFYCWVDSRRGVELMTDALRAAHAGRPVDVVIELGAAGGRSGVRDLETAVDIANAVKASPMLRLAGVSGYEGAITHGASPDALAKIDAYLTQLRTLVGLLADGHHFDEVDRIIVTAGGSAYFNQVAEAQTQPWPDGLDVLPVLRSGAYIAHDDGIYRAVSPFARSSGTAPFRAALRAWAQVTSRPTNELALLTLGKRDASFDEGLPEPQVIRRAGATRQLTGCEVTRLADQHAFVALGADSGVEVGDWMGLGLSHPCTVFDKWPLIPVVDTDGETVIDFIRTYF